jgi:hypothetical protein
MAVAPTYSKLLVLPGSAHSISAAQHSMLQEGAIRGFPPAVFLSSCVILGEVTHLEAVTAPGHLSHVFVKRRPTLIVTRNPSGQVMT